MKIFFRLLSFARPYRRFAPKYAILAILSVIFGVVNFSLLIPLLNVLFGTYELPETISQPEFSFSTTYLVDLFNYYMYSAIKSYGKHGALQYVCGVILLFVLLGNFFKYTAQRVITNMRTYAIYNIKKALFNKMIGQDIAYFHDRKKGDVLSVMSNDVQEVEHSLVSSFQVILKEPLMFIGFFVLLFSISVKLTLFTIILLPVSGFMIGTIARKLRRQSKESQLFLGSVMSMTDEAMSGIKVVKAFNAEEKITDRFDKENFHLRRLIKSIINKRELASPVSEVLGVLVAIVIIYFGSQLVFEGQMSASEFITYIIIYSQVLTPAKSIAHAITMIQRGLAAGERIFELLDVEPKIISKANSGKINDFQDKIEFRNITFSYGSEAVLKDIDFSLSKGKRVALVGPSGGGKSTLADLIPRFYDVDKGVILLDGVPVTDINIESLRSLIGIVTQEPVLFNDTIYNNIAFGIPNATAEDVHNAARIANAYDFIQQSENGFDTIIGDRGVKLSGGQRQRISIARAVLKNPPILILDEATSALDTESEKLVQDALNKLMKNRTSVVIAHRLSTIIDADEIIVLQKGMIKERGTHKELLEKDGLYKKLYSTDSAME